MPALANITVKKADGTTDVVYTAVSGAAGDNVPALFRNNTVGTTVAERPSLMVRAAYNGPKTARRVRVDYSWPIMKVDAGGNKAPNGRMSGEASVLIPESQDPATINEQAYQFGNLIASAIIKSSFAEGYGPR